MISIGQNIKGELDKQERTVTWLAQKLGCNRIAVYRILCKNSIDTALLARISIVMKHDFFKELSDEISQKCIKIDT